MAQDGLQVQELFTSLPLCREDKAALLRAVRRAEPTFRPPPPSLPSPQVNTSPLLRDVYDKVSSSLWAGTCRCGSHMQGEPGSSRLHGVPGAQAFFSLLSCLHLRDSPPALQRLNNSVEASSWSLAAPPP